MIRISSTTDLFGIQRKFIANRIGLHYSHYSVGNCITSLSQNSICWQTIHRIKTYRPFNSWLLKKIFIGLLWKQWIAWQQSVEQTLCNRLRTISSLFKKFQVGPYQGSIWINFESNRVIIAIAHYRRTIKLRQNTKLIWATNLIGNTTIRFSSWEACPVRFWIAVNHRTIYSEVFKLKHSNSAVNPASRTSRLKWSADYKFVIIEFHRQKIEWRVHGRVETFY